MFDQELIRKKKRVKKILIALVIAIVLLFYGYAILNAPPPLDEEYKEFHDSEMAFRVKRISVSHGQMCLYDTNQELHCLPGNEKVSLSVNDSIVKRAYSDTLWLFKYEIYVGYSQKTYQVISNKSPG